MDSNSLHPLKKVKKEKHNDSRNSDVFYGSADSWRPKILEKPGRSIGFRRVTIRPEWVELAIRLMTS